MHERRDRFKTDIASLPARRDDLYIAKKISGTLTSALVRKTDLR